MRALVLILGGALAACATSNTKAKGNLGRLDKRFASTAATAEGAYHATISLSDNARTQRLMISHKDADLVPKEVLALVERTYPKSKVVAYQYDLHLDAEVHQVEVVTAEGKSCEVSATADGGLRYTECRIGKNELPDTVLKTLVSLAPHADVVAVEETRGKGFEGYAISLKEGERVHYLAFGRDGALQKHTLRLPAVVEIPVN